MNYKSIFTTVSFFLVLNLAYNQTPPIATSSEIYKSIQKLNFLGTVLYVAAHPDDENTRLIAHLANHRNADTHYLSLTRGDGGQNLIGPEIRELLGVIRTQELLAARRTDNGSQIFSRANDFGYSKNAEETIKIWDDDKVKSDLVWAVRKLRPDVIINRFDHRTSGTTHGHHTASAALAFEMFEKTDDKNTYPEQLKYVSPWKASRLYFNTSWWFYGSEEAFEKADKTRLTIFDVGKFIPELGYSDTEIAALSRSNHKCQGFGSAGTRGDQKEYLELLKGGLPKDPTDLFSGINTTWTRVAGGTEIDKLLSQVQNSYDFRSPKKSVASLMQARTMISKLKDEYWKDKKIKEIDDIIADCLGLFVEGKADNSFGTPSEVVKVSLEAITRLGSNVTLKSIKILPMDSTIDINKKLSANVGVTSNLSVVLPKNMDYTSAYWLRKPGTEGLYTVDDQQLIGLPETPCPVNVIFNLEIGGLPFSVNKNLIYKYTDPERGEVYQPFEVVPELSVGVKEKVIVFGNNDPKLIHVQVASYKENQKGTLSLDLPLGWNSEPKSIFIDIASKGDSKTYQFSLTPPQGEGEFNVNPKLAANGKIYTHEMIKIDYQHIPLQRVIMPSSCKVSKINIKSKGSNIAYVMGTGDEIPENLQQIGYKVTLLDVKDISVENLQKYDALIMGVRAYNKHEDLKFKQEAIFDYVKNGGTFIIQYNTNGRDLVLPDTKLMPYSLKLSRERVTLEDSEVRLIAPSHEVLNYPNKITQADFKGWVQERGLYFPTSWDPAFTPVLSCNDDGEPARDGGLLVAKYGSGYCVYTGYSWFRQLPAGVTGAYRLFANIISLGKQDRP